MASDHAALNSLDDSLTELGDGAAGSAGVMGSILRAALEKQAGKLAGNSKLKEAIQNNDREALTAIIAKQLKTAAAKATAQQADDLKSKIAEVEKHLGAAKHSGLLGNRREEAEIIWRSQRTKVQEAAKLLKKNKKQNKRLLQQIEENIDAAAGEDFKLGANEEENKQESARLKNLQSLVQLNETQKKKTEEDLFAEFQVRLGGLSGGSKNSGELNLPKKWESTKANLIIDPIRAHLINNIADFYAIAPDIIYVLDSYNNTDGSWVKPPTVADGFAAVPKSYRKTYTKQAAAYYRLLLSIIGQQQMAKVMSEFKYGIDSEQVCDGCGEDDGPSAIYAHLAKYGGGEQYDRTDLEARFIQAPQHFRLGNPRNKIDFLHQHLQEILRLSIPLKADQTLIPIAQAIQARHTEFIVPIAKYLSGGPKAHDCASTIAALFSEVEVIARRIERREGDIWHEDGSAAHAAKIKGRDKKKSRFSKTKMAANAAINKPGWKGGRGGKGKGKGGDRGGDKFQKNNQVYQNQKDKSGRKVCAAKGCDQCSHRFRFCTKHHKEGLERGHVIMKNGYKFEFDMNDNRVNNGDQDKAGGKTISGFSAEQMEGLKVMLSMQAQQ